LQPYNKKIGYICDDQVGIPIVIKNNNQKSIKRTDATNVSYKDDIALVHEIKRVGFLE